MTKAVRSKRSSSSGKMWHIGVVAVLLLYLFLPVAATLLFSVAKSWQSELIPADYTLEYYRQVFADPRFAAAVLRTTLVGILSVTSALVLTIPAIFVLHVYYPRWEKLMQITVILSLAFPPVVAAIGLIKLYSSGPLAITGTIWILIGVYFIIVQPFIYQSVRNSLGAIHTQTLLEAAEVLGANKCTAFIRVVLPNLLPGTLVAGLLAFSVAFGEFVLSKMLVGGEYETIQMYLYNQMKISGQAASAVVISYFLLILLLSGLVLAAGGWKPKGYKPINRKYRVEEEPS